ncbi:MAG: PEGA domain-containing protein [Thermotogota bacterium]|nr:PEGA domain-containing protein [Thermotogota bacterium]
MAKAKDVNFLFSSGEEEISRERFDTFGKILMQDPKEDDEKEREIREILKNYNNLTTLGVDYILTMTERFFEQPPIIKQIRIETKPTNAAIYINGSYKGTSPITTELQEGTHSIEARKDGYITKRETKTIGTQTKDLSRTETITIILEKETGSVYINSTPSNANIYINGSYKGTTSKTIEGLEVGSYSLKLTKSGYNDKSQNVTIKAGKRETLNLTLEIEDRIPKLQKLSMVDWQGNEKSTFDENDTGVAFSFEFTNWVESHEIYGKWYKPDGGLYAKGSIFTYDKTSDGKMDRL